MLTLFILTLTILFIDTILENSKGTKKGNN